MAPSPPSASFAAQRLHLTKTEEELVEFDKKYICETPMLSQRGTPASMSRDKEH
jgi:hypothetical protein